MRDLVMVHGRSQQHHDSLALKAEWIADLQAGLAKSGLTLPVAEANIRFPYYGDALDDLVNGDPDDAAAVIVRGAGDDIEKEFVGSIVSEVAARLEVQQPGITAAAAGPVLQKGPLNWPWVRAILQVVDQDVPLGSGASIALFTHDVYQYLRNPGIRDRIETGVRGAFTPGVETVVVAHSLGTVVSYQLLRREAESAGWRIPLYVTLGCPLAVKAIKDSISPLAFPGPIGTWFNALDPRDIVALYPLDPQHFPVASPIENKADVDNPTENRHGISGYLGDPVVAKRIYDALTA